MEPEITLTQRWIHDTILGLELCPWARPVVEENLIRYAASAAKDTTDFLKIFLHELELITDPACPDFSTTLIVLPLAPVDFVKFWQWVEEAQAMLEHLEAESLIQLVAFHPQFYFQGHDPKDLANWVNRAPLPILQLLRAKDVAAALQDTDAAEKLSARNEAKIKGLSQQELKKFYFWV